LPLHATSDCRRRTTYARMPNRRARSCRRCEPGGRTPPPKPTGPAQCPGTLRDIARGPPLSRRGPERPAAVTRECRDGTARDR
jgi:hypothetical protein